MPGQPKICICMATFNPPEELFRRQVESIRGQSFRNWVCLIQDDCSASVRFLRDIIAGDARFELQRNSANLGFYLNFQHVLDRVRDCEFVSLADQDDVWYPHKLASLLEAMRKPAVTLAYSDMRITDGAGSVIANSFWGERKNQCSDFESLFFTNTVTGAASLFRAALLPGILPFPPQRGKVYHDWWIAMAALAEGEIRFVNEPLQDYCQHSANAVGWRHDPRPISLSRLASGRYRREMLDAARQMYREDCTTLDAAIELLCERFPHSRHYPAMRRLRGLLTHPVRTMLLQYLRAALRSGGRRERNILLAHALGAGPRQRTGAKAAGIK